MSEKPTEKSENNKSEEIKSEQPPLKADKELREEDKSSSKSIFESINEFCQKYRPTIEVFGILTGIAILGLTYWSTLISRDLLSITIQQEQNKILPIWDWKIIDDDDKVQIFPFQEGIKIQRASAYLPKKLMDDNVDWDINPPEFYLHLNMLKSAIEDYVMENMDYNSDKIAISTQNAIPFGVVIDYIQYGTTRRIHGVYALQFTMMRTEMRPDINIDGVIFEEYVSEKELKKRVDKLTEELMNEKRKR